MPLRISAIGDVHIAERHYNASADGYMVRGNLKDKNGMPVTGWVPRHDPGKIFGLRRHFNESAAQKYFNHATTEEKYPQHPSFLKDWQKGQTYAWEGDFIYPHKKKIDEEQARALVQKVCADYKIKKPPAFYMMEKTDNSYYDFDHHEIYFGHRDNIGLLHELAHVVVEAGYREKEQAHHCPVFVWAAIELYHRYADLDLSYMITSAQQKGLLGDMSAAQHIFPKPDRRP